MNSKQRKQLKQEIAYRDVMTKKMIKNFKFFGVFFLFFFAITIWGFTGMNDAFLQVSDGARNVIKWIGLVLSIITGLLSLGFLLSGRNSKKYTLNLIDKINEK